MHIRWNWNFTFLHCPWELRGIQSWSLALITLIKHICIEKILMSSEAWTNRMRKKSVLLLLSRSLTFQASNFDVTYLFFPLDCVLFLLCWFESWADRVLLKMPKLLTEEHSSLALWAVAKPLGCCFPLSVSSVVPFDLCCAQLFFPLNVPLLP